MNTIAELARALLSGGVAGAVVVTLQKVVDIRASRQLERLRSELTFGAELRRQVATKRIEALLRVHDEAVRLTELCCDSGYDEKLGRAPEEMRHDACAAAINKFGLMITGVALLFDAAFVGAATNFRGTLLKQSWPWIEKQDPAALQAMSDAQQALLDVLRRELLAEPGASGLDASGERAAK